MEWIMFLRPMFTVTRVSLILQYHCYYSMRNWWHISTFTSYLQNAINSILDTLPQGDRIHTPDLNNITGLLDSMDDDAVSESDAATEAAVNSIPQFWTKNRRKYYFYAPKNVKVSSKNRANAKTTFFDAWLLKT